MATERFKMAERYFMMVYSLKFSHPGRLLFGGELHVICSIPTSVEQD